MKLPKCPACQSRRDVKRIRTDWFRCTECGSIWESRGFTEQERLAQYCPVCNTYVEYANWQPCFPYGYSPWDSQVLKNFHYNCHEQYIANITKQQEEFEKQIARAEAIGKLICPNCSTQSICWEDEQFYYCMQCDTEFDEDWINEQLKAQQDKG